MEYVDIINVRIKNRALSIAYIRIIYTSAINFNLSHFDYYIHSYIPSRRLLVKRVGRKQSSTLNTILTNPSSFLYIHASSHTTSATIFCTPNMDFFKYHGHSSRIIDVLKNTKPEVLKIVVHV